MTALTVEQVDELRRAIGLFGSASPVEKERIALETGQWVILHRKAILAALSERGGAVAIVEHEILDYRAGRFWYEIQSDVKLLVGEELYTRPQAGQEKLQPHHIAAVERAILDNEAQANRLIDQRDYSAEIPLDDAKSLREVLIMLAAQGGSHG